METILGFATFAHPILTVSSAPTAIKRDSMQKMKKIVNKVVCVFNLVLVLLAFPALAVEQKTVSDLGIRKNMRAEFLLPEGEGPFPGVLVLHTSSGVSPADLRFAHQLALEGYAGLVPYYFDAYGIGYGSRHLASDYYAEQIFADLVDALEYMKKNPKINKQKLGAVGFSMGGYFAVILAAKRMVSAGVSYYGVFSGGRAITLKYNFVDVFTGESSPVLILHGSSDSTQPVGGAQGLASILDSKKSRYELKIYPGVDHSYDRGKSKDAKASEDSWNQTVEFLRKHLKETNP